MTSEHDEEAKRLETRPAVPGDFGAGQVTPIGRRVVLRQPKKNEKTMSGLYIPDTVEDPENSPSGIVIATGPNVKQVKVGDVVFLRGDSVIMGMIGFDRDKAIVLFEDQIMGIYSAKEPAKESAGK